MKNTQQRPGIFERLSTGLSDGIDFTRGRQTLKTTTLPEAPPSVSAREIVALRERLDVSQGVMARILNVSPRTIQSWEHGTRSPSQSSLRLLQIMRTRPDVVREVVGVV